MVNYELLKKVMQEQEKYKKWLCEQPAVTIINHAFALCVRENIVNVVIYMSVGNQLSDEQYRNLLETPDLLDHLYRIISAMNNTYTYINEKIMDTVDNFSENPKTSD